MTSISENPFASFGLTQTPEKSSDRIGQAEFFKLMTAQLKNQDPTKPLDSAEFLGQIAQFSQVSGIQDLNTSFASLSGSLVSSQALQASSLVGRSVLIPSQTGFLEAGGEVNGVLNLDSSANNVSVDILTQSGSLIRTMNLGMQPAGPMNFRWDGMDDAGNPMPEGIYQVEARASLGNTTTAISPLIEADITSVSLGGKDGLAVNLKGLGATGFEQIKEIR